MVNKQKAAKKEYRNPWAWIPSLYFAEGIPYVVAMTVAVIMFKRLGISNTDIALYTSWLYLPWVIKPLWSPVVDLLKTKRWWIVIMQLVIGAALGGIALAIPLPGFFKITLIFLWLLAFSSATHDIAADGFYMLGLDEHKQAYFVGIRSTFYRIAMITGQGLLIILAGFFEVSTGLPPLEIELKSNTSIASEYVNNENFGIREIENSENCFYAFPQIAEISTQNISIDKIDSVRAFVNSYNQSNGFVKLVSSNKTAGAKADMSFWTKYISEPLKTVLLKHFGSDVNKADIEPITGNYAVVAVKLGQKPEGNDEMVLNLKFEKGDKSLKLIEGERLTFSAANYEKPAYILFQADQKLKENTSAVFKGTSGNLPLAWSMTFIILAILFVLFSIYHRFMLPHPAVDKTNISAEQNFFKEFFKTFVSFFKRKDIGVIIAFLMLYRLGESQLVKMASPFLLDPVQLGGLGLTTGDVGWIYGTFGILALTAGGIIGGLAAAKKGFKYWIWYMALAINLPNLSYVYLSFAQPDNHLIIGLCVAFEQLCYGFGFTAYMLYMIYISEGKNKTAHFAIATGFMALGMMLPGMFSGWLQEIIGYRNFFVWIIICMIPGIIPVFFIKVNPEFGIKKE